jgi:hypothetical protein
VLKLRDTSEAKELRRIWAERLWSGGAHVLEGYGTPSASMENVQAGRDVIQFIGLEPSAAWGILEELSRTANSDSDRDIRRWLTNKLRETP